MNFEIFYLMLSTIVFLLFGILWERKNILNLLVKFYLLLFGLYGILLILYKFGYLIKM